MTDTTITLSSKELEVLREILESSDSDAPEVTAILERVTEAAPSTAPAEETQG